MSDKFALDIPLDRIEKKIRLGGQLYVIREMTGIQRDGWLTSMGGRVKSGADGKPSGLRSFENVQADLIFRCLYDASGNPVLLSVIQSWPASAQNKVFKLCQEINGLDEKSEEEVKND